MAGTSASSPAGATVERRDAQPAPALSVVVPVRDEADNIRPLIDEIVRALDGVVRYEIIYVDDGSRDATPSVLDQAMRDVAALRRLRHETGCGQSAAVLSGVLAARAPKRLRRQAQAAAQIGTYERAGFGRLPVCIAKTHLSISSDPTLKGAPTGWTLPVREVRASVGAGFVYPICGEMRTMPGLGSSPAATRIDIDDDGLVMGLS